MAEGTHPLSGRNQGSVRLALGRLAFLSPGETLDLQGKSLRERLHLHNIPSLTLLPPPPPPPPPGTEQLFLAFFAKSS